LDDAKFVRGSVIPKPETTNRKGKGKEAPPLEDFGMEIDAAIVAESEGRKANARKKGKGKADASTTEAATTSNGEDRIGMLPAETRLSLNAKARRKWAATAVTTTTHTSQSKSEGSGGAKTQWTRTVIAYVAAHTKHAWTLNIQ
jgi:hypothetical protein